jgi:hypothetical protein
MGVGCSAYKSLSLGYCTENIGMSLASDELGRSQLKFIVFESTSSCEATPTITIHVCFE